MQCIMSGSGPRETAQTGGLETPPIGLGEVCVRVRISGINPSDVKRRGGQLPTMPFPRVIPHQDGAGVIEAVGGVWRPRGWANACGSTRRSSAGLLYSSRVGRLAECAGGASPRYGGLCGRSFAGRAGHDGASLCLRRRPVTGQTVLVAGGAGAVGYYAIQLAKWGGAQVITTVSAPAKAEVARTAGANHVVNYRNEDVAARIRELTGGSRVDRV